MFELTSAKQGRSRLTGTERLTAADFSDIAKALGVLPLKVRKMGLVAARRCSGAEQIETRWNGKETENWAARGDWVVTNLTSEGEPLRDKDGHSNTYVIRATHFTKRYERAGGSNEFGGTYRPILQLEAVYLNGGFDIVAPWGERQISAAGYLMLSGNEVYGNHEDTFHATYVLLS